MGELIVNGIKWAFIITVSLTFLTAILTFLNLINSLVLSSVVGEVIGVISCFLPFNASVVFSNISAALAGILSFMIAQKIFDLTANQVQV